VRKVAKRFGVSPAALDRHRHHDDPKKNRQGTDEIKLIDKEIRKLHHAETAARKRRDNAGALAISRELRNWHTLKSKLLGSMTPEKDAPAASVSERDALQMAQSIIEANLSGDQRQQVCDWLTGLMERIRPPDAEPLEGDSESTGEQ
jgi:hypothetical protein